MADALQPPQVIPAPAPAPVPAPQPAPQPQADPILDQVRTSQRLALRESLRQASSQDPERAASIIKLATATRLHPDTAAEVEGDAKAAVAVQAADVDGLMRDHPEVAGWLLDRQNAAVAQDDLPGLRALDMMVRQATAGPHDDPLGILPKGYQFDPGRDKIIRPLGGNADDIGDYQGLAADLTQKQANRDSLDIQAQERDERVGNYANPFIAGALSSLGSTIRAGMALTGADAHNLNQGAGDIAASSAEQFPGFGWDLARAAGGMAADAPLLLAGGPVARAAASLGKLRGTMAALNTIFEGKGADALQRIATTASMAPLAARSGLSSGQEHGATFGAVDALINLAIPGAFGRVGVQRALTPTLEQIGKGGVETALPAAAFLLKQSGLDAGQNAVIELASAIHEVATGVDPDALNPGSLAQRLALSGTVGGAMGGIFNLPEAARIQVARRGMAIRQAQTEADALGSATQRALESKTVQRSPDQARGLVQQVVDATGGEGTVYAQGEAFREHFQGLGEDPAKAAEAMGVDPNAYAAAMAGGSPLPIPLAGWLTKTRPEDKPLLEHMTMRPDALSRDEAGAASDQLRQDIDAQVKAAANKEQPGTDAAARGLALDDSAERVGANVEEQLIAAGQSPSEAKYGALAWSKGMRSLAERWNAGAAERGAEFVTPESLFNRYHVKITGKDAVHPEDIARQVVYDTTGVRELNQPAGSSRKVVDQAKVEEARGRITTEVPVKISRDEVTLPDRVHLPDGSAVAFDAKAKNNAQFGRAGKRSLLAHAQALLDHAHLIESGKPDTEGRPGMKFDYYLARAKTEQSTADVILTVRSDRQGTFLHDIGLENAAAPIRRDGPKFLPGHGPDGAAAVERLLPGEPADKRQPPNLLGQPGDGEQRGQIRVGADKSLSITLLANADRSTFLHETGHAYLEILHDLAGRADAAPSIKADAATVREWLGAKEGEPFTEAQHEQFARGFERYLFEGKAPSSALRRAFAAFAKWLKDIYHTLGALNVELTPEVRGVFDRLLAVDAEIEHASRGLHAEPFFTNAQAAGMTAAEFARYQRDAAQAKHAANDSLRADVLSVDRAEAIAARDESHQQLTELLTKAMDSRPDMQAVAALQDGAVPEGLQVPEGTKLKLDRAEIVRAYGEDTLKDLPGPRSTDNADGANAGRRVYAEEGGLSLADAATLFGFKDGDELIGALIRAPDRDTEIGRRVNEEMAKRYPDPTPKQVADAASAHLADELAESVAGDELNAAEKLSGQEPTPRQLIKEAAQRTVEGMNAYQLRPDAYRVAAEKAGIKQFALQVKLHDATTNRGEVAQEVAAAAKERLLNLELYRAARRAKEFGERNERWVKQRDTLDAREKMGKAGGWEFVVSDAYGEPLEKGTFPSEQEALSYTREHPGTTFTRTSGYLEQWDAIQEGFSLKRASNRALRRRESLRQWINRQEADGEPVAIADEVVEDLGRKRWQELTVGQQRTVSDALRNVHNLATMKNRLMAARRKADLDALADTLQASIDLHATGRVAARQGTTPLEKLAEATTGFLASHKKDSFTVRAMDGGEDGGPLWEAVILPRNNAATAKSTRMAEAGERRHEALQAWDKTAGITREAIPGTHVRLSREQRIGMALYWGSREGRQRVLADLARLDHPGTESDAHAVLDSLDKADWALVRETWTHISSYWHEIASLERRTTGVAPERVEALPFTSKNGGTLAGGYYPIKYDHTQGTKATNIDDATDAKSKLRAANVAATTRRGFTKQRAEMVQGRGLRYDFGVMAEHLQEVLHDLTHREMLQDQNRIFRNEKIAGAIVHRYGKRVLDQLLNTTADIAQGEAPAKSAAESFARLLRRGGSAAVFGWNATSALANVTGILQALPRVGPGRLLQALSHVTGDAMRMHNSLAEVEGRSAFMATRARTYMREVAEANATASGKGKLDAIQRWGYWPMTQVQRVVDAITWHAAHDLGIESAAKRGLHGAEAAEHAVNIADQTVIDTQGSGRIGDLAAIQRGGEVAKTLTTFYSYFSTTVNLMAESGSRAIHKGEIAQLAGNFLALWALPAVLTDLIGRALRGDTGTYDWKKLAESEASYGLGMLVGFRELSGVVQGRSYSGPASFGLIGRAGQLVNQLEQGQIDRGLFKAAVGTAMTPFGLPVVEMGRFVDGVSEGWENGRWAAGLRTALFGKPRAQ